MIRLVIKIYSIGVWIQSLLYYLHTHVYGKINDKNIYVNENNRLELGEMAFTYEYDSTEKRSKESDILSLVDLISYLTKLVGCQGMNDELICKFKKENSRALLKNCIYLQKNPFLNLNVLKYFFINKIFVYSTINFFGYSISCQLCICFFCYSLLIILRQA